MPYYLKHPDHGTHIAYTPEEVAACRKHGWTPVEETVTEAKQPEPEPKKRGRKPKVNNVD